MMMKMGQAADRLMCLIWISFSWRHSDDSALLHSNRYFDGVVPINQWKRIKETTTSAIFFPFFLHVFSYQGTTNISQCGGRSRVTNLSSTEQKYIA